MYTVPKLFSRKKPTSDKISSAKQQLELEYWLSKALEEGRTSLECSG
jgi:hypothetical protein